MHVKVISGEKQEFMGKVYTLYEGESYLSRGRNRLHRVVFEYFNHQIPDGYHVHHLDHNPLNNEPDNLSCIALGEHLSEHLKEWHRDNPEASRVRLNNNQHKCIEWHRSKNGREWHREHYERNKEKLHAKVLKTCDNCLVEFDGLVRDNAVYCSNKCKSSARRKSGVDNEFRTCLYCESNFEANKYSKVKTCSRSCSNRLRKCTN